MQMLMKIQAKTSTKVKNQSKNTKALNQIIKVYSIIIQSVFDNQYPVIEYPILSFKEYKLHNTFKEKNTKANKKMCVHCPMQ